MIYRIQATSFWRDEDNPDKYESKRLRTARGGAFFCNDRYWDAINDLMIACGLRTPPAVNTRARFWFTERGYDVVGRDIVRFLSSKGENVRVLQKKNPKRSDVVWGDCYQIALLPTGKRSR